MLFLIFCTVLAVYIGYIKPEMITSVLATYSFVLINHFRKDKISYVLKTLATLIIIINKDFYSFLILVLGLKVSKYDILFFLVPLFFLEISFERGLIIALFVIISITFFEHRELRSKLYSSVIDKDRENLLKRLRKKEELERRFMEDEKIKYEERKNLLGTLHHLIGHTITASILELKAIEIKSGNKDVKNVRNHLEEGLKEIRRTLHTIRDESIDFNKEAEIIKEDLDKNGITFKYNVSESTMDTSSKKELLNILKEGVTNVLRHSNSNLVTLSIVEEKGFFRFKLFNDDYDDSEIKKGLGLESMARFAEARNGYFGVNTDKGFEVIITYPKTGGENARYSSWWRQDCCK